MADQHRILEYMKAHDGTVTSGSDADRRRR